jgi:hypothetical protein
MNRVAEPEEVVPAFIFCLPEDPRPVSLPPSRKAGLCAGRGWVNRGIDIPPGMDYTEFTQASP